MTPASSRGKVYIDLDTYFLIWWIERFVSVSVVVKTSSLIVIHSVRCEAVESGQGDLEVDVAGGAVDPDDALREPDLVAVDDDVLEEFDDVVWELKTEGELPRDASRSNVIQMIMEDWIEENREGNSNPTPMATAN
jgi:hypothetical protein